MQQIHQESILNDDERQLKTRIVLHSSFAKYSCSKFATEFEIHSCGGARYIRRWKQYITCWLAWTLGHKYLKLKLRSQQTASATWHFKLSYIEIQLTFSHLNLNSSMVRASHRRSEGCGFESRLGTLAQKTSYLRPR